MVTNLAGVNIDSGATSDTVQDKSSKENVFEKFKEWYTVQPFWKKVSIMIGMFAFVGLFLAGGVYSFIIYTGYNNSTSGTKKISDSTTVTPTPTPTPISMIDPLTGITYTGADVKNLQRPPIAAMIENFDPDARPQTGVNQADIVYETLAEGGITRWMPIFLSKTPYMIGPVRSARTYFLDWVSEYNAIYVHWGENSDVAPSLVPDNIRNIDAIYQSGTDKQCSTNPGLFCRNGYNAPHNGFGFPSKIWDHAAESGWNSASQITSWTFKDDSAIGARANDGSYVTVNFATPDTGYNVKWVYDKNNNQFVRYDDSGKAYTDKADNSPITAKNVAIRFVDGKLYTSAGGKEVYTYNNIGTGTANIFVDGKEIDGKWTKDSRTGRTMFVDNSGNPISFDKGRTWIETLVNGTGSDKYFAK